MKKNILKFYLLLVLVIVSCSKKIEYSPEFIKETSGKYLYNQDELIEVYYKNNKLYLNWREAEKLEPLIIDEKTFFMVDMYKKFRFVQDPTTKKRYLAILPEDNKKELTYDFLKVPDTFKTPSMYLKNKEYKKAVLGYLEIKKKDSTSTIIEESKFNSYGYELIRKKEMEHAIQVFKINVALYPNSSNVYDSLGDAYLRNNDSLQAFNNYKKALELNNGNRRAKKYVNAYNKKQNN
ncbi:MAG: tetratricopeptide repeat protein [Oceanihabitans sp.]